MCLYNWFLETVVDSATPCMLSPGYYTWYDCSSYVCYGENCHTIQCGFRGTEMKNVPSGVNPCELY